MGFELAWMRADAPYMPIATAGLLAVLADAKLPARARWADCLRIETEATLEEVAQAIAQAPLPDVDGIAWPTSGAQAIKSSLEKAEDPLGAYHRLLESAAVVEHRLLVGLVTDQVVDDARLPARSRLLRGAKSDLSAFRDVRTQLPGRLQQELALGPQFGPGKSGRALGLVPEVQTFGGSVGREASTVNAESPLLSLLLRHGILALPPVGAAWRGRRVVGGPLIDDGARLSWPRWNVACGLRELRAVFSYTEIHASEPNPMRLRARGIDAVYRSAPQQLSTTVAVFRWGARVA